MTPSKTGCNEKTITRGVWRERRLLHRVAVVPKVVKKKYMGEQSSSLKISSRLYKRSNGEETNGSFFFVCMRKTGAVGRSLLEASEEI